MVEVIRRSGVEVVDTPPLPWSLRVDDNRDGTKSYRIVDARGTVLAIMKGGDKRPVAGLMIVASVNAAKWSQKTAMSEKEVSGGEVDER